MKYVICRNDQGAGVKINKEFFQKYSKMWAGGQVLSVIIIWQKSQNLKNDLPFPHLYS